MDLEAVAVVGLVVLIGVDDFGLKLLRIVVAGRFLELLELA